MQYIKLKRQAEEVDLFSDDEVEEGTQPISHEDYERLIKYLEKKNPPAILPIQIAYYAGLRIGETCGLKWQDINLEEQCLKKISLISLADFLTRAKIRENTYHFTI